MHRTISSGLTALGAIAAIALNPIAAGADNHIGAGNPYRDLTPMDRTMSNDLHESAYGITPFELTHLAYYGYFTEQGLSSYAVLLNNYQNGELTSQDVVQAGVASDRLDVRALTDENYISSVDQMLEQLNLGRGS